MLFLSIAMVLTGILLYLWPQMRLVHLGYRQGTLQSQRFQMLQEQQKLQVELATLRRMSRIEDIATRRLGMRPPRTSQIIYVRAEEQSLASRRP